MSLVAQSLQEWTIYAGNPAKPTGKRSRKLLDLVARLRERENAL
jgi:acetyltransferase-like isoleucine patch superfamily enzyme